MILAFAVLCLSAAALAEEEAGICGGDGNAIKGFGRPTSRKDPTIKRDTVNVRMPCKYHAVKDQKCGDYQVTVTPGNIYLHPIHYHDTLWISVKKRDGSGEIDMRTTNKKVVKFIKEEKDFFLTKKGGTLGLEVDDIFESTVAPGDEPTVVANNSDFRITFTAWDPDNTNKDMPKPKWSFKCFAENFEPLNYTQQLCGGNTKNTWKERGFKENVEYPYYDVFTTDVVHTNEKCEEAEDLFSGDATFTNCTTYDKKLLAIHTCSPILHDRKRNKCVTKYVCDAMDVFLSCVKWVCSDFHYTMEEHCEIVGEAIDFCREFPNGDLSKKVEQAKCYKEYLRLPKKYYKDD